MSGAIRAEGVAEDMQGLSVMVIRRASEMGHLYGSVTVRDIAEAAEEAGVFVDRRQIRLARPIKELGLHEVTVQLHPEVTVSITANIARTPDEAEAQARGEDVLAIDEEDSYRFESGLAELLGERDADGGSPRIRRDGWGSAGHVGVPAAVRLTAKGNRRGIRCS